MSRPKTGSVDGRGAVGENGTRFAHSRTVSHAAPSEPADRAGRGRRATTVRAMPASGRQVGHVVGLEGDRLAARRTRRAAGPAPVRRRVGLGGLVEPVDERRGGCPAPSPGGGLSRPASQRFPSRTTSGEHEAADEQPEPGADPGPEDAVEPDARVPEGVGPQVDADAEQEENAMTSRDPEAAGRSAARRRRRRAVVRAARRAPAAAARCVRPASGSARASEASSARRSSSAIGDPGPSLDAVAVVRHRHRGRRGRSPGSGGVSPARLRLAPAELLHEVVEQVAHRRRESSGVRRGGREASRSVRPSTARRNAARTVSASSFVAHRRRPRRLEPEGRPHGQRARATAGSGRRAARSPPSRIWSRPASSRISPDSAPATAGPRRPSGGSGGGPAAGATSRKLTTPSSSATHSDGSHQPSGASDGRAIPARRTPVADPDLVLAQERRAGRRKAVGHAPQDSGRVGVRRACSASAVLVVGGRAAAAVDRRRPRPRLGVVGALGARRRVGRRRSAIGLAAAIGQVDDPALGGGLGQERVGLGLEVGDLGLELEPEDLAPDRRGRAARGLGVGRAEASRRRTRR